MKALVATALKIKPIMGSNSEGTICQLDQARGMNKALVKMVDKIVEVTENSENKIFAISHCNSPKKANMLKEAIQEKMKLSDIVVLDTAGVSSMYANDGGIIVAVRMLVHRILATAILTCSISYVVVSRRSHRYAFFLRLAYEEIILRQYSRNFNFRCTRFCSLITFREAFFVNCK